MVRRIGATLQFCKSNAAAAAAAAAPYTVVQSVTRTQQRKDICERDAVGLQEQRKVIVAS